jgi:alkanesulfonate monooxygenase SsuD/methylene tetrahydromethanopterin reductase-like flavin-dependent oxidoreductase (luciferase family)
MRCESGLAVDRNVGRRPKCVRKRLEEAIEIIRRLRKGVNQSYRGRYFTVENACLYSPPDSPPPLHVAVGGPRSADLVGRLGDGMIGTDPDARCSMRSTARAGPASRSTPS